MLALTKLILALIYLSAPCLAAGEAELGAGDRIFYLFSPESLEQRQRVMRLWQQFGDGAVVRVVAIARSGQTPLDLPLMSVAAANRSTAVPEYIKARLDAADDYFAIRSPLGVLRKTGRGEEFLIPLAIEVATEVDESTWGKVKELFR